jgi:hypothetical protein
MTDLHPLLRLLPRHDHGVKEGHPGALSNDAAMLPVASSAAAPVRLERDDRVQNKLSTFEHFAGTATSDFGAACGFRKEAMLPGGKPAGSNILGIGMRRL